MRFKVLMLATATGVLCILGWASALTLETSTFTPDPGGTVNLFLRGAPADASFHWDLDGDGAYERVTAEPWATVVVPAGLRLVQVRVVSGGKVLAQLTSALVADARLGATRSVTPEGPNFLVTITVSAKIPLIAPGFVEQIPAGFTVEVVAEGGAFWRKAEKLEAIWPVILDPGQTVTFTYRLYPLAGVSFSWTGLVSAYVEGKRVEIPIAGAIRP